MVNFDTDRLLILFYKAGSGGKTVANFLGLSNSVVLQDPKLAQQQLQGDLSSKDKLKILVNRISDISHSWDDLKMGCTELFGFPTDVYVKDFAELKQYWSFNSVISDLSNSQTFFTIMANDITVLKSILKVWPQARVIVFSNPRQFIKEVRPSWQPPGSMKNYSEKYDSIELKYLTETLQTVKYVYNWDCTDFLDNNKVAQKCKKLYNELALNDYNEKSIRLYHQRWLSKLIELRDKHEQ